MTAYVFDRIIPMIVCTVVGIAIGAGITGLIMSAVIQKFDRALRRKEWR